MRKKILITGCCGFVGRHFCHFFSKNNNVTGVDNMSSESSLYPEQWMDELKCEFNFIEEDVIKFLNNHNEKYDIVIHLAAIVGGRQKIENNPLDVAKDLIIDSKVIEWCTQNEIGKLIYFSSSAVYPVKYQMNNDEKIKLSEILLDFKLNIGVPDLTYGWAKMTGEYICKIAHESSNLNIVCYRPFSGYGEDQNLAYPLPAIMDRINNLEDPITIWSDSVRDFVHIDDIVNFVNETMYDINNGDAINIGTSIPTSFSELVKIGAKIKGYNPKIKILDDKPKGVYYRVSDSAINFKISLNNGVDKFLKNLNKTNT